VNDAPVLPDRCTLALLAGGQGTRMGQPKADLKLGGQPILSWLLARFHWPGPTLLVTAPGRQHPPGCEEFDAEAIDPVADLGPLRGVLTALETVTTDLTLVTTVDMPGIDREQLDWLLAQMNARPGIAGLMTQRPIEGRQQIEPFPAIFRSAAAPLVRNHLEKGRRSVHRLTTEPAILAIEAQAEWDDRVWTNLNFPGDVDTFLQTFPRDLRDS
jgi:molybdopterin-guanine dinucleotide biosynthesis protein A